MGLTDSQRTAIETLDRHLAVTAGPGSGKTRVLVERYLWILEHANAGVENIVAITFTKKAATEMRERLRKAIDERITATRRTAGEALWRDRKRRLESAVITTIHGFCSRVLREHPVEAGVDPHFTTLDDYTQSVLLDDAVQSAVSDLIESDNEAGTQLVAAYSRGALVDHIERTYSNLRGLGISIDGAEATTMASLADSERYLEVLREIKSLISIGYAAVENISAVSPRERAGAAFADFEAALDRELDVLEGIPSVDRASEFSAALERLCQFTPPGNLAVAVRPIVAELKAAVGAKDVIGELELAFFDACAAEYVPIVFDLLREVDVRYARAKASVAALDYEDLQLGVRALLQTRPDVAARLLARYRYVLVDEFQDTNGLQRDIVRMLGLAGGGTNVFIVGDRKQSIYGFRGAEVEVFGEAIHDLDEHGGMRVPLSENFRSDARLVAFQNGLFTQLMTPEAGRDPDELESLGFVEYETGIAERPASCEGPAVELLLDFPDEAGDDAAVSDRDRDESSREREARLLAQRVREIVDNGEVMVRERRPDSGAVTERPVCFGDFAMLFGATTNAKTYERALRLNKVPYYVVAGKGFYDRPEITDVLNLLGFIDNSSDELALAAVLRSPMFGVSDDTLLALRIEIPGSDPGELHARPLKPLFDTVRGHTDRPAISDEQHGALDEAVDVLETLLAGRNRMSISRLIAEALERTRYTVVAAAADDGPQRLSNLDKLSSIARQYERGGMRLLRDFVDYVGDFRRLSAREAEANLRSDVNALAILTAHSSKGLEFPVVVLPDLQRVPRSTRTEFAFDRMVGLGFKVPDGRGGRSTTGLLERISARATERKRFEDQRLLYVAVTRAEEYLILSGASDRKSASSSSWLGQLLAAFETSPLEDRSLAKVSVGGASVKVTWAGAHVPSEGAAPVRAPRAEHREARDAGGAESRVTPVSPAAAVARARAMLEPVRPSGGASLPWLSATSLQNFAHCPRQFYFTRLLRVPELVDITAARDDGEREAPDGRLPASLRGLVVHRFCETYVDGDDVAGRALASLRDVVAERGDVYEDVLATYDEDAALAEVLPFARNYVASALRARIESAAPGDVLSELDFRVDLEHGTISGAIDKLVIERDGPSARAVVIDFKTGGAHADGDFAVQMQAYAVAASELEPSIGEVETVLHFLGAGPDAYTSVVQDVPAARAALDSALETIGKAERDPRAYPTRPGDRCAWCRFSPICPDAAI